MKKTPLKIKKVQLKKSPLKTNSKELKKSCLLKKTSILKNKGSGLNKTTELKKQNEKAKEKWEQVRNQILERDDYKCVVCGKPATQVHHIHLRSKRKDLMYEKNNLVSLCDKHHDHSSEDGLEKVNRRIAEKRGICLKLLLKIAEMKDEEYKSLKTAVDNAREYIQNLNCLKDFKEGEDNVLH